MPTESVRSQSTARITIAPTVATTLDDGLDYSQTPRIVIDPPRSEPQRKSIIPTIERHDTGFTEHKAFMSGGLREWLKSSHGLNSSGESVVSMLRDSNGQHTVPMTDRRKSSRPRSYSRRSSRASQSRARSFRRSFRGQSPKTSTTLYVAPPPRRLRLTAIFPFLLSAAAFICSLVLVLAGSKNGLLTNVNIVSVSQPPLSALRGNSLAASIIAKARTDAFGDLVQYHKSWDWTTGILSCIIDD